MVLDRFDVIVVGCGPAGATAARAAAARGATVMVVDRRRSVGTPPRCAGYVPRWLRERTGFDDSAVLQTVQGTRLVDSGRQSREVAAEGFILDRTRFDKTLAIRALEAGADLANAMVLRRTGERVVGRRGGLEADFSGTYIVGADGPGSVVGRSVGLANSRVLVTMQYEVGLKAPDDWIEYHRLSDESQGIAWLVPCGRTARVGVALQRNAARHLKRVLSRFFHGLVKDGRVFEGVLGCTGGPLPVNGPLRSVGYDHVLLAGDAGGLAQPFSGVGIAAAVVSGEIAGDVLGYTTQTGNGSPLEAYNSEVKDRLPCWRGGSTRDLESIADRMAEMAEWRG